MALCLQLACIQGLFGQANEVITTSIGNIHIKENHLYLEGDQAQTSLTGSRLVGALYNASFDGRYVLFAGATIEGDLLLPDASLYTLDTKTKAVSNLGELYSIPVVGGAFSPTSYDLAMLDQRGRIYLVRYGEPDVRGPVTVIRDGEDAGFGCIWNQSGRSVAVPKISTDFEARPSNSWAVVKVSPSALSLDEEVHDISDLSDFQHDLSSNVYVPAASCPGTVNGDLTLRLPWPSGVEWSVTQGYCCGCSSPNHTGYQIDFGVSPAGQSVNATAAGTVSNSQEFSSNIYPSCPSGNVTTSCGGTTSQLNGTYVKLLHQGAQFQWFSWYLHLTPPLSSKAKTCNAVYSAREFIASSGNTGCSSNAHLHFQMNRADNAVGYQPTPMRDIEISPDTWPITNFQQGKVYQTPLASPASAPITPANNSTGQSTTPTFTWSAVTGATSGYRIVVGTIASALDVMDDPTSSGPSVGSQGVVVNATPAANTYTPPTALAAGTIYYWRVKGRSSNFYGESSARFQFTTTGGPTPTPTPTPTRIIGLSGSLAFGDVQVGSSTQRTLTISNTGNSSLTVSSISYPTAFSGSFSGTVPAGGSQNVTVTFTPTAATNYGGTVTVNANQTSGTNTITASGTGTTTATRIISLSGNLAFGDVQVGSSAQRTLTISNTGNSSLTVSSISYPNGFSGSFSGTVPAGGSQNVTVTFAPTTATNYGGTVTVNANQTSGTNTIVASGAGTTTVTRIISLSGNLAFGDVQVGSSAQRTLTISNTGNSSLTVSSISYPNGFSGSFSGTVPAGGSQNVTVNFAPTAATNYGGTVTVNANQTSGTNTITASGAGTTTPTRIISLSGNLAFGDVQVGSSAQRTLTISNTGSSSLTVTSISYPTAFSGNFSGTVPAGGSQNVAVTFAPTAAADYGGTVTVSANQTSGTNTITASGAGTTTPTPGHFANISTRLRIGTGDNAMIAGFIINGTQNKPVIVRGLGPSLGALGVLGALADPIIEVHGPSGAIVPGAINDNWQDAATRQQIIDSGLAPTNNLESALWGELSAVAHTVIVQGKNNTGGVGLAEVYDVGPAVDSKLANVSTRGFVETGNNVMIGGTIISGNTPARVVFRGIGPSLVNFGVPNALQNPTLELRDSNGGLLVANDNWQDDPPQAATVVSAGLAPSNTLEAAIAITLAPGPYTVILAGKNNTIGVAVVEAYQLQ